LLSRVQLANLDTLLLHWIGYAYSSPELSPQDLIRIAGASGVCKTVNKKWVYKSWVLGDARGVCLRSWYHWWPADELFWSSLIWRFSATVFDNIKPLIWLAQNRSIMASWIPWQVIKESMRGYGLPTSTFKSVWTLANCNGLVYSRSYPKSEHGSWNKKGYSKSSQNAWQKWPSSSASGGPNLFMRWYALEMMITIINKFNLYCQAQFFWKAFAKFFLFKNNYCCNPFCLMIWQKRAFLATVTKSQCPNTVV
jgi:hypothetical protein